MVKLVHTYILTRTLKGVLHVYITNTYSISMLICTELLYAMAVCSLAGKVEGVGTTVVGLVIVCSVAKQLDYTLRR